MTGVAGNQLNISGITLNMFDTSSAVKTVKANSRVVFFLKDFMCCILPNIFNGAIKRV
jgi:hypothetical protein